jgi:TolB-like protein
LIFPGNDNVTPRGTQLVIYTFEDYSLDIERQELKRGVDLVKIDPQVIDLLQYLIRNRERVVSKDDLIANIWNGRIVSESTLTSRIFAVRQAIGDSGDHQRLIRTIARKGIRFIGAVRESHGSEGTTAEKSDAAAIRHVDAPSLAAPQLPDKPSIVVLPFTNMSGDPEQEYFSDGITEDIITGLSRQPWFFVISRNSAFSYRGEAVDVREVGVQLGVRYVLEGSVRKVNDKVRITGQLIDAANGNHLWADRYDRELADIFELQDEITNRVIGSVSPQILVVEAARVRKRQPQNIDAWDVVMQALPHMWRMRTEEHQRALELLQRAVQLDSDYAHAHALIGWIYLTMFNLGSWTPIGEFTDKALELGIRSVALDEQEPWGHLVLGLAHARRRRSDLALRHLSRSVELIPSFALGYAGLGYALACGGEPERGLQSLEQAHRLSPRDPFLALYSPTVRYMALFALERYQETIEVCRATIALHPNHAGAWRLMTVSLGLIGEIDQAKEALAHTLTLQPDLSSAHVENDTVYVNSADRIRFLEGLRKAGLSD